MDLFEFIKIASGVDERNLPKSTAALCLVELVENENNELVSNIKQMLSLINIEIYLDCFVDGYDDNGYIEAKIKFNNPYSAELKAAWNMLEQYKKNMSTMNMDIDEDVEIKDDFENMIELMIMPRETMEKNPVFLELAFPINFNLCSNEPGTVADSIDFFFNTNSCCISENEDLDMEQMNRETNEYLQQLEAEIRYNEELEKEKEREQEEFIKQQAELKRMAMQQAEKSNIIRVGGRRNEDKEGND